MAIRASKRNIIQMFVTESMMVLVAGIAIGSLGAGAVANLLRSHIFGVEPFDLSSMIAATALIVAAGLMATWWPAQRTAAKSPAKVLNEV